jgi:hypothetical protein
VQRLLDKLGDGELRDLPVWKMEVHTSQQIAERLGRALATVERHLGVIRKRWEGEDSGRGDRRA